MVLKTHFLRMYYPKPLGIGRINLAMQLKWQSAKPLGIDLGHVSLSAPTNTPFVDLYPDRNKKDREIIEPGMLTANSLVDNTVPVCPYRGMPRRGTGASTAKNRRYCRFRRHQMKAL